MRSLEKAGAVVTRADDDDRRLTRIFVTAAGRLREKEQRVVLESFVNQTIGALSEADRLELERLLGVLAEHTQAVLSEESQGRTQAEETEDPSR